MPAAFFAAGFAAFAFASFVVVVLNGTKTVDAHDGTLKSGPIALQYQGEDNALRAKRALRGRDRVSAAMERTFRERSLWWGFFYRTATTPRRQELDKDVPLRRSVVAVS